MDTTFVIFVFHLFIVNCYIFITNLNVEQRNYDRKKWKIERIQDSIIRVNWVNSFVNSISKIEMPQSRNISIKITKWQLSFNRNNNNRWKNAKLIKM
jgi:hypothetical protein